MFRGKELVIRSASDGAELVGSNDTEMTVKATGLNEITLLAVGCRDGIRVSQEHGAGA